MTALEKETKHFIYHVAFFVLNAIDRSTKQLKDHLLHKGFPSQKMTEQYEYIKHLNGELHGFSLQLQEQLDKISGNRLQQLISCSRNAMYAAKNLKDAFPDILQLKRSSNDEKYSFYLLTSQKTEKFFTSIIELLTQENAHHSAEQLTHIYRSVQEEYAQTLKELYKESIARKISEVEFSTLLNFNREMYTLEKSILFAMKDFLLSEEEAAHFDELPGFIR